MGKRPTRGRDVQGILLLDKPPGISSNASLQEVKRLYRARKAGHTGSLDRIATGMLPVCLGEATKLSGFLLHADKRYRAVFKLGVRTTTGDSEGRVVETRPVSVLGERAVLEVLGRFIGSIEQVPPMFSAVKHQGQRLYRLAHQGVTVEREARVVNVHELNLLRLQGDEMEVEVACSKGTYVRTLAEDIGEALATGVSREQSASPGGRTLPRATDDNIGNLGRGCRTGPGGTGCRAVAVRCGGAAVARG